MSADHPYEQAAAIIKSLAAAIREHVPPGPARHDILGQLTNLSSWLLLVDGERQDALEELSYVRRSLVEVMQQLGKE
jgi:hypothetical protein